MTENEKKLSKIFNDLENPSYIGSVVGTIISSFPSYKVSILGDSIILYPDQLYINNDLYDAELLKVGDNVKVTPMIGEQTWFIDSKIRKVGG